MRWLIAMAGALAIGATADGWRASVSSGVELSERDGSLTVGTGPAVDLWPDAARPLAGAYGIRATLRKLGGRRHEGYGFLFGGRHLGTDSATYSYVMVRGDGNLLVKKRSGAALTVVRNWTHYAAIRPDDAEHRAENRLELGVTPREVVVRVNGTELVRVPARELVTSGIPGLRVSHQMRLEVTGFEAR